MIFKQFKYALKTLLLCIVWLSLLTAPYAFISYICYGGLCGGPEASSVREHPSYISFLGYYTWLYPILVIITLFLAGKMTSVTKDAARSIPILLLPGLLLIPLLYVEFQIYKIHQKYAAIKQNTYSIHPDDFVCRECKFIRLAQTKQDNKQIYSFFECHKNKYGMSWSISYLYSYKDLQELLQSKGIDIKNCKNKKGNSLSK